MCFTDNDCDWTAQATEDEVATADKPVRCMECRRKIPAGGWVRHISMQQYDECRNNPLHEDYDGPETDAEECPPGCEHDYGETFAYVRCETCDQLLRAIHDHEIAEGCKEYEAWPNLEGLYDALAEGPGRDYLARAEAAHPGVTERLTAGFRRAVFGEPADAD